MDKLFKKRLVVILMLIVAFSSCRKKEFDAYYGRPESLADPIYQQLKAKGNFSSLLTCIDKSGYKDILGKAGYWTMFAPNDEAFRKFMDERSIGDASAISKEMAEKIVKYALIYNAFKTDHISDYQSIIGWIPNIAFKRRTAYYDGFYKEHVNGKELVIVASNRNNAVASSGIPYYVNGDNNNKYISYFHRNFMSASTIPEADYSYFYPGSPFSGFNVLAGQVKTADIIAENGVIHEVTQVSLPMPSIDQYLKEKPQYSLFKSLLDKYLVTFVKNSYATKTYQILTGSTEDVHVKVYDAELAFSPNNENYLKNEDNDGQADGYSMFVPTNEVLQNFIDTKILEHYKSLDQLPKYILVDLINAHMWQSTAWPSKFESSINALEEPARFDKNTNVVDKKILSNGLFYGTNKIQEANVFYTVYSKPYLNPEYTLMTRALNQEYKRIINNPALKFTVFMMSDKVLRNLGFDYDIIRSEWRYTSPTGNLVTGNLANYRIQRILYNSIVYTSQDELKNLSGSGYIRSGDRDIPGEYIKWNANTVYAAGNEDLGKVVNIIGNAELANNGRVYYTDNLLEFSERGVGLKLAALAAIPGSQFNAFFQYLKNSSLYNAAAGSIKGLNLGTSYTILTPNTSAIQSAIAEGWLPASNNPSSAADKEKVERFILYHILSKNTVAPDGNQDVTSSETLLKDDESQVVFVKVNNQKFNLVLTDKNFRSARVINESSNHLADRTMIHLIDNYLKY